MPNQPNLNSQDLEKKPRKRRNASDKPNSVAARRRRSEAANTLTVQKGRIRTKWYNRYKRFQLKNGPDEEVRKKFEDDCKKEVAKLEANWIERLPSAGGSGSDDNDRDSTDETSERGPSVGVPKDSRSRNEWGQFTAEPYMRAVEKEYRKQPRPESQLQVRADPEILTQEEVDAVKEFRAVKKKYDLNPEEIALIMEIRAKNGKSFAQTTMDGSSAHPPEQSAPVLVIAGNPALTRSVEAPSLVQYPSMAAPVSTESATEAPLFHGGWNYEDDSFDMELNPSAPMEVGDMTQQDPPEVVEMFFPGLTHSPTHAADPDGDLNFDYGDYDPMAGLNVGESGASYYGFDDGNITLDDIAIKEEQSELDDRQFLNFVSDEKTFLPDELPDIPDFLSDIDNPNLYEQIRCVQVQHAAAIREKRVNFNQMLTYTMENNGTHLTQIRQNDVLFKEEPSTDTKFQPQSLLSQQDHIGRLLSQQSQKPSPEQKLWANLGPQVWNQKQELPQDACQTLQDYIQQPVQRQQFVSFLMPLQLAPQQQRFQQFAPPTASQVYEQDQQYPSEWYQSPMKLLKISQRQKKQQQNPSCPPDSDPYFATTFSPHNISQPLWEDMPPGKYNWSQPQ